MPGQLSAERRAQLDSLVERMEAANEPEAEIRAVVEDFKQKYASESVAEAPRAPGTPEEPSALGFAKNVGKSGAKLVGDLASGLMAIPVVGAKVLTQSPMTTAREGAALASALPGAMKQLATERYGGIDATLNTLYRDPLGVVSDAASVLPAAGAVLKLGQAPRLVRAGQALSKAGAAIDPLQAVGRTVAKGADLLGEGAVVTALRPSPEWRKEHGTRRQLARDVIARGTTSYDTARESTKVASKSADALHRELTAKGERLSTAPILRSAGGPARARARAKAEGLGLTGELEAVDTRRRELFDALTERGPDRVVVDRPPLALPEVSESTAEATRFVGGRRGVVDTRDPSVIDLGPEGFHVVEGGTRLPRELGEVVDVPPHLAAEITGGGDLPQARAIPSTQGIDPLTLEGAAFEAHIPDRFKYPNVRNPLNEGALLPDPPPRGNYPPSDPRAAGVRPPPPAAPPVFRVERGRVQPREVTPTQGLAYKRGAQEEAWRRGSDNDAIQSDQERQIAAAWQRELEKLDERVGPANKETQTRMGIERAFEAAENRGASNAVTLIPSLAVGLASGNLGATALAGGITALTQSPRVAANVGIGLNKAAQFMRSPAGQQAVLQLRALGMSDEMIMEMFEREMATTQ